jgi:hypothetical protein
MTPDHERRRAAVHRNSPPETSARPWQLRYKLPPLPANAEGGATNRGRCPYTPLIVWCGAPYGSSPRSTRRAMGAFDPALMTRFGHRLCSATYDLCGERPGVLVPKPDSRILGPLLGALPRAPPRACHLMQAVVGFVPGHEKPYSICAVWDKPAEAFLRTASNAKQPA